MAHPMDLRELLEARDGRPTEYQAARKIATFAVIPAAMVGLLAGTQLVGLADPIGRLLWVCTATDSSSRRITEAQGVGLGHGAPVYRSAAVLGPSCRRGWQLQWSTRPQDR